MAIKLRSAFGQSLLETSQFNPTTASINIKNISIFPIYLRSLTLLNFCTVQYVYVPRLAFSDSEIDAEKFNFHPMIKSRISSPFVQLTKLSVGKILHLAIQRMGTKCVLSLLF